MGLFDNPEYFRANVADFSKEKSASSVHDSLVIKENSTNALTAQKQQLQQTSSNELIMMTKYDDKLASTPLLCEKSKCTEIVKSSSVTEQKSKKSLLIVKIILSVIFGNLINQSISYLFAIGLIKFINHTPNNNFTSTHSSTPNKFSDVYDIIEVIFFVFGFVSTLFYSLAVFWVWRPSRTSLIIVLVVSTTQLVIYGLHILFNIIKVFHGIPNSDKIFSYFSNNENHTDIFFDFFLMIIQFISIIFISCEICLIK